MSETRERPFVTVVMPVRNEAGYIERSLGAVLGQDYPAECMEVLVVDGASDDGTPELVRRAADGRDVRLLQNPNRTVPYSLNIAINEARGDILVRVDGHCIITPDYVSNCVRHLQQDGVQAVGGWWEIVGEDALSEAIAAAMSSKFGVGGVAYRMVKDRDMLVESVPFPAYWMDTVRALGPFDEEMTRNQDDEYNYRLRKSGGKVLLAQDVHSVYYSRSSFKKLWKQYFQYGFWKVRVLQKHPRQVKARQFVPPLFVAGLGGSALLALFWRPGRALLALAAGMYAAANLAASLLTARRRGWHMLPVLPALFATLHFSYGSGFLIGLIKHARRWKNP